MTKFKLKRLDSEDFEWSELAGIRDGLEKLIHSGLVFSDEEWNKITQEIIAFQEDDGGFRLLTSGYIPGDAYVDFCLSPTYICTAVLMKAVSLGKLRMDDRLKEILHRAMTICCLQGLAGNGYDWLSGLVEAVDYFIAGDVKLFLKNYPDICPEFVKMMSDIRDSYSEILKNEDCDARLREQILTYID